MCSLKPSCDVCMLEESLTVCICFRFDAHSDGGVQFYSISLQCSRPHTACRGIPTVLHSPALCNFSYYLFPLTLTPPHHWNNSVLSVQTVSSFMIRSINRYSAPALPLIYCSMSEWPYFIWTLQSITPCIFVHRFLCWLIIAAFLHTSTTTPSFKPLFLGLLCVHL